ncbi:MAG TPA: aminotransferase class III-fold pyridoxal phosphate-dependent enzyme [Gryllotalpicola sp.]
MSEADRRTENLTERDARAIAGIEKLRFFPLEVVSGHGSTLVDPAGRELIDLTATWTATGLGHGHPAVVEAVTRSIRNPPGMGGLSAVHPDSVGLAEDLLALVPGTTDDRRVYLGHAGSDANDVAIRACRHATGKRKVLSFEHSYHGGVGVAMGVSGVHVEGGAAEADPDSAFLPYPNPYRPRGGTPEADLEHCLREVEKALAAEDAACLLVEPILSDGGFIVPPDGFLARLSELTTRYGVLLICDEVKVGLGRPGTLHAFQHDGITPDIATFGKTLGAGLPISAAVGPAWVLDGPVGSALLTTAGNPVCTAAARAVLATIVGEGLPQQAAERGARLLAALQALASVGGARGEVLARHIGDLRGRGLGIGLEIVSDPESKTRDDVLAEKAVYRLWQLGAVVYLVGGNVLEITPPLVITDAEIDRAAELIGQAVYDAAVGAVDDALVAPFVAVRA